jgi:hypothetical protein
MGLTQIQQGDLSIAMSEGHVFVFLIAGHFHTQGVRLRKVLHIQSSQRTFPAIFQWHENGSQGAPSQESRAGKEDQISSKAKVMDWFEQVGFDVGVCMWQWVPLKLVG